MCRILSYLGKPIVVEELLYKPDNSFIKQSYHPHYMSHLLNLAGFGMVAWDGVSNNPDFPYLYKTPQLPFYDENLRNLTKKIMPKCMLAHLRGVEYTNKQIVSSQNVHPFLFDNSNLALAHNGALFEFDTMKYDLLEYIKPDFIKEIKGSTDSEWIYAILLSQFPSLNAHIEIEGISQAIIETLKILQRVRHKHNIIINSPVNLFVTNGEFIAATRFVFDFGWYPKHSISPHASYHTLWYTYGDSYGYFDNEYKMKSSAEKSSIIISSEPLTQDTTTWMSVPEYTLIIARLEENEIKITSQDINL